MNFKQMEEEYILNKGTKRTVYYYFLETQTNYARSSPAMCLTLCQASFDVCMILGIPRDAELFINHLWRPYTMVEKNN